MPDLNDLFHAASTVGGDSDSTSWLIIDHDFRTISIPANKRLLGVTSDEKVNTLYFKCPRYYENVDLNDFIFRINYLNANREGDQYWVDDKAIDGDYITFSWTVGRHACQYSGNVNFIVCAILSDNGVISQEYNTAIHSLSVIEGLETTEAIVEEKYDIIADLLERTKTIVDIGDLEERIVAAAEAAENAAKVQENVYNLTLSTNWSGSESPYTQTITIPNYTVTNNTKVNLTAGLATIAAMKAQNVASIMVINDNGVLTAYADGHKPTTALSVQAAVYEIKPA